MTNWSLPCKSFHPPPPALVCVPTRQCRTPLFPLTAATHPQLNSNGESKEGTVKYVTGSLDIGSKADRKYAFED